MSFKDIGFLIAGYALIILGILGLFLPFLQGILFIVAGLYILSGKAPWAQKLLRNLEIRYPRIVGKAKGISKDIKKYFTRLHS